MAQILLRCTPEEHRRIKAKAAALKMSMNDYLRMRSLDDDRERDREDSAQLAELCYQLMQLHQALKQAPSLELVEQAIELCRETGKEVTMYRLRRNKHHAY